MQGLVGGALDLRGCGSLDRSQRQQRARGGLLGSDFSPQLLQARWMQRWTGLWVFLVDIKCQALEKAVLQGLGPVP